MIGFDLVNYFYDRFAQKLFVFKIDGSFVLAIIPVACNKAADGPVPIDHYRIL